MNAIYSTATAALCGKIQKINRENRDSHVLVILVYHKKVPLYTAIFCRKIGGVSEGASSGWSGKNGVKQPKKTSEFAEKGVRPLTSETGMISCAR